MFAVPGWNIVPSNSLVQQNHGAEGSQTDAGPPTKKRKRHDRDVGRKIPSTELEQLWDQRFGGKRSVEPNAATTSSGDARLNKRSHVSKTSTKTPKSSTITAVGPKLQGRRTEGPSKTLHKSKDRVRSEVATQDQDEEMTTAPAQKSQAHASRRAESIAKSLPPPPTAAANLTPLQAKMRSKLTSARFRHLNETLYTTSSTTALSLFASSPELFAEYHAGFSQQVSSAWPRNPVEDFIAAIKNRGPSSNTQNPLPRRKTQSCTIADLGCGDAPLARALIPSFTKKLQLTIHSYDLHAASQHITVADVANLPLRDGEADIAIFCLSLMGTNWVDFVDEAWRVLRGDGKGEVWVAEVKSRFTRPALPGGKGGRGNRPGEAVVHSVGKRQKSQAKGKDGKRRANDDDLNEVELPSDLFTSNDNENGQGRTEQEQETSDIRPFVDVFTRRGFQLKPNSIDAKNKMFVSMTFCKSGIPTAGKHKGMKWTGKQYERMGKQSGDSEEEEEKLAEGKVLKPCVYKLR